MKNLHELDKYRIQHPFWPQTDKAGSFKVFVEGRSFIVIASVDDNGDEGQWEHISVQPKNQKRCPTWNEMSEIKDMFFDPEEEAVEYHPKHSRYVNIEENCLHIWRPVKGELLRKPDMAESIQTLKQRDERLEELWSQFTDVPMDPDTEKMEDDFLHFPHGTDREEIWHWFDERYSKGVYNLLYHDGADRTEDTAKLVFQKSLCIDCDAEHCAFNPDGVCKFPFVSGREPRLDEDGCRDFRSDLDELDLYFKKDRDFRYEDIRNQLQEIDPEKLHGNAPCDLENNDHFLEDVYLRWEKLKDWSDNGCSWDLCEDAIDEVCNKYSSVKDEE